MNVPSSYLASLGCRISGSDASISACLRFPGMSCSVRKSGSNGIKSAPNWTFISGGDCLEGGEKEREYRLCCLEDIFFGLRF